MKKRIGFFCVVLVLSLFFTGVAEETDLSSYSDEAIIALNEKVQLEIVKRGIGKTAAFARGRYIIGEYIPAGLYIIKATGEGGWDWGNITVRTPDDKADDDPSKLDKFVSEFYPYVGFIDLEEGDVLESPVLFTLTIAESIIVFK